MPDSFLLSPVTQLRLSYGGIRFSNHGSYRIVLENIKPLVLEGGEMNLIPE